MNDLSDWLTVPAAAAALATTERTIRRMIARREIQSALRPCDGRKPEPVIHPGDVERIRAERTAPFVAPAATTAVAPPAGDQLAARVLDRLAAIAEAMGPRVSPAPLQLTSAAAPRWRPWLTLDEAADYSGLSARLLRAWIRAGRLAAVRDGREWKTTRAALDALSPARDDRDKGPHSDD